MSGYLFKVSALLAVLQKQILRIGIRFGSKGFGSKLRGDLKISFDRKRKTFAVKNKRLCFHRKNKIKSFLAAKHVYFSFVFPLSWIPSKNGLQVTLFKNIGTHIHLIKSYLDVNENLTPLK